MRIVVTLWGAVVGVHSAWDPVGLYRFGIRALYRVCDLQVLSSSLCLVFLLSFEGQKFSFLTKSKFLFFSFMDHAFDAVFKKSYPRKAHLNQGHDDFPLVSHCSDRASALSFMPVMAFEFIGECGVR